MMKYPYLVIHNFRGSYETWIYETPRAALDRINNTIINYRGIGKDPTKQYPSSNKDFIILKDMEPIDIDDVKILALLLG